MGYVVGSYDGAYVSGVDVSQCVVEFDEEVDHGFDVVVGLEVGLVVGKGVMGTHDLEGGLVDDSGLEEGTFFGQGFGF